MNTEETAVLSFNSGFNCAQAVLTAYSVKYNLDRTTANKISCGFGAGCGRQSLTCGAVTGAYMVIGLKYGKAESGDEVTKEITYKDVIGFSNKFKSLHKSINCTELLGADLGTEEGRAFAKANNLSNKKCANFVKDACTILNEMGY